MTDQPPQPQQPQQPPQPGYAPQPPPGGYAYPPPQAAGRAIPPTVSAMLKSKSARNLAAAGLLGAVAVALLGSLLAILAIDGDRYADLSFMNRIQAAFEWIDIPFVAIVLLALALYHQAEQDGEPDTSPLAKQGDNIRNMIPLVATGVAGALLLFTFLRFIGNLAGDEYGVVAIPKFARFFYDIALIMTAAAAAFWALAEMQRSGALKQLSQPSPPPGYPQQGYPQQYPPQGYPQQAPPAQQPPTAQYPPQPPPGPPPAPPAP